MVWLAVAYETCGGGSPVDQTSPYYHSYLYMLACGKVRFVPIRSLCPQRSEYSTNDIYIYNNNNHHNTLSSKGVYKSNISDI